MYRLVVQQMSLKFLEILDFKTYVRDVMATTAAVKVLMKNKNQQPK